MSGAQPFYDPRWYESFFDGPALAFWQAAIPPERIRREVDLAADLLELEDGDPVLDVPCGFGRHALDLSARGYRVTGADLSREAIAEARATAEASGLSITLELCEMRALPWREAFAGTLCLGNAFGYFDPAGMRDFLAAIAAGLRPGGRFLLHSAMAAESLLPHLEPRMRFQAGPFELLVENSYDPLAGRLDTLYRFKAGGREDLRCGSHWIFTVAEIRRMLEACGFGVLALYADCDFAPYVTGSEELYLLSEKA